MKVICTQENLKAGLATVGRIISSSNTLPILSNILIKTQNGLLEISSTNLEVAITTQIRCKVDEDGGVTVNSKTVNDLVNNFPNKNILLQSSERDLKIEAENYHTSVKTLPAEEFPLIPKQEGGYTIEIDAQELKTSLDQVIFAASTNQTQPEISGVFFGCDNGEVRIAATDRYRLAEKKVNTKDKGGNFNDSIIPQKTLAELSRIIGNQKGVAKIIFSETQVFLSFNDTNIISRLIDGQYPDYKQIIPAEFKTVVTTQKAHLVNALRAASVFSQASNSVSFGFSEEKQTLTLSAESSDLGKSDVELPAEIKGGNVAAIFNYRYMLDCLASVDSENIVIKIIDDNSPSLILAEEKNDYIYLVMPIKS